MSNTFINGESNLSIRTKLNNNTLIVEDRVLGRRYASAQKESDTSNNVTFSAGEATAGTFKKIPLTFTYALNNGFTAVTNGLQYTDTPTRVFEFHGNSTVQSSETNTTIHLRLAKNGTTIAGSESSCKVETTGALNTIAGIILLQLEEDDILEVYAKVDKACTISAYHTALTLVEV